MLLQTVDGERDQLHVTPAEVGTELSGSAEFSGADGSEVSRVREQDAPADGGTHFIYIRHSCALNVSDSNN